MALLRQLSSLRLAQGGSLRAMYSAQAATSSQFYDVPEGHATSDLSQWACNIGLNRRRDLTLGAAAEISLTVDGKPQKLPELLKVIPRPDALIPTESAPAHRIARHAPPTQPAQLALAPHSHRRPPPPLSLSCSLCRARPR
jgi:hypothetical protein